MLNMGEQIKVTHLKVSIKPMCYFGSSLEGPQRKTGAAGHFTTTLSQNPIWGFGGWASCRVL